MAPAFTKHRTSGPDHISSADLDRLAAMPRTQRPRIGRILTAIALLILLAWFGITFANGEVEWEYVREFLTARTVLEGLFNTIVLSIVAMAVGIVLGVVSGTMHTSSNPVLRTVATVYIWAFRGTPVLLQLFLWFNLALVLPTLGIPGVWEVDTIDVMTPFVAALIGLGLNEGAYVSEIVRGGLLAVPRGQVEAARSIGMTPRLTLQRIVIPQAVRIIVPPLGNQYITLVKMTSLASITEFQELLYSVRTIYYANSRVMELLIVAAFWYLLVVATLTLLQKLLERRLSRGHA